MQGVRETLYRSLFEETPPFMGEILREHDADVFPGKSDFIRFLRETDNQKRIDRAKLILLRLSFEAELLLPNHLITALLQAEENDKAAGGYYIPQDHFVHLVNLYLLGIYIFTHHKKLHRSLNNYFKGLRTASGIHLRTLSDEAALLDFVFTWRAFVLIHDVGYTWEIQPTSNSRVIQQARDLWKQIPSLMKGELTAYFLSKMGAWKNADSYTHPLSLKNVKHLNLEKSRNSAKDTEAEFSFISDLPTDTPDLPLNAVRVPTIHGTRFFSTFTALINPNVLVALLVHSRSGDVHCLLVPDKTGKHKVVGKSPSLETSDGALIKMAFSEGRTPKASSSRYSYEWYIFCPGYDSIRNSFCDSLRKLTSKECSAVEIARTCSSFLKEGSPSHLTITSDRDYRDSEFCLYRLISQWSRAHFSIKGKATATRYAIVNSIAISEEKGLAKLLADGIEERIKKHLSDLPKRTSKTIQDGIESVIDEALRPLSNLTDLKKDFIKTFGNLLKQKTDVELQRGRMLDELLTISEKCIQPSDFKFTSKGRIELLTSECLHPFESSVKRVNSILESAGAPTLTALLDGYRPSFLGAECVDHGLASAVCAISIAAHLRFVLEIANSDQQGATQNDRILRSYAQLALSLGETVQANESLYQADVLMDHVAAAIALHNIYPIHLESLGRANFRVNLRDSPFSFFAMLCDALQTWDRDKRIAQSAQGLPYKTVSDCLNIEVQGDIIKVTEMDHGVDIVRRANQLKIGLESYLSGVSDFIRIELGELRH